MVTGHSDAMFNVVLPSAMPDQTNGMMVGLTGRSMRDADSRDPRVVHVQKPDA